ncbi:MAG: shikimate dehydrogenase [Hydrogenovibrio crunogenus]|uniref:Shikimate dehydrogenase (NADP(+)) n=1 Tax=Hydrogenovibrio crunogenus (strain DSM 25203 / XCL-2) TaxID=317025 RepID=AROE_HYDCU|nr:RecName: Full=Shikimate dehydrogenase (NADP(+)); Short=SDH [Hydrogenovibrio crunogenus XCL-2]MBD3611417.1 shikimate dehydrogenase [Hydrogenovibrio crunogenus]
MTDLYAVVGNPIAHSKSPLIHRLFAEQTDQDLVYEALLIDTEDTTFQFAISDLIARGYRGINITVPFKLDAFELADELSPRAEVAHAVNTFSFKDGKIFGDNTDGIGLVTDIEENANRPFKDQKVLILGAGGAVQGILQPLLEKQPGLVHIANRTAKRAEVLGKRFETFSPITSSDWEGIPDQAYDIIINGTSASLEGKLPPINSNVVGQDSLVYDMMYGAEPTIFMQWAQQHQPSCQVRDGLGMLVGQAAEAFYIWRGVRPQTQSVIDEVRRLIQA